MGADLSSADLRGAFLPNANLSGANLRKTDFYRATLWRANLSNANMAEADLSSTNLNGTILRGADLTDENLRFARLVAPDVSDANFSGSFVYGCSFWNLKGTPKEQFNVVITPEPELAITVDNVEVAQFIYLLLKNQKIRHVIDTITSKVVLILGRFTPNERPFWMQCEKNFASGIICRFCLISRSRPAETSQRLFRPWPTWRDL